MAKRRTSRQALASKERSIQEKNIRAQQAAQQHNEMVRQQQEDMYLSLPWWEKVSQYYVSNIKPVKKGRIFFWLTLPFIFVGFLIATVIYFFLRTDIIWKHSYQFAMLTFKKPKNRIPKVPREANEV